MRSGHIPFLLASTLVVFCTAAAANEATQGPHPVPFETSGSPEIRDRFDYGVTMLHSFEYPETGRVFGEIIEEEPGCAIAYWGAAMSVWHPLWASPGVADLRRGADLEDTVDKHPVTPGEVLPARELLADLLLEAGEFSRALVEYETVLENAPNRLNALVGAAEAADNSRRPELAVSFRETIGRQVKNGSGPRAASLEAH